MNKKNLLIVSVFVFVLIMSFGVLAVLEINIVSPTNPTYNTQTIDFNITTNNSASLCQYSVNGTANVSMVNNEGNKWGNTSEIPDGHHNVIFSCNDTFDVWSSTEKRYFIVDTIAPLLGNIDPGNFTFVKNESVLFNEPFTEEISGMAEAKIIIFGCNKIVDDIDACSAGFPGTSSSPGIYDLICNPLVGTAYCSAPIDFSNVESAKPFMNYKIYGEDNASNEYSEESYNYHLFIDTEAPSVILNQPLNNSNITEDSTNFVFNVSDDSFKVNLDSSGWPDENKANITCELYINDGVNNELKGTNSTSPETTSTEILTITIDTSIYGEGHYPWYVKCKDNSSRETQSETRTFNIADDCLPSISLVSPDNGASLDAGTSYDFIFNVQDANDEYVTCTFYFNDKNNVEKSPWSVLANGTDETVPLTVSSGDSSWIIECYDGYNTAEASRTFTVTASSDDDDDDDAGGGDSGAGATCKARWLPGEWGSCVNGVQTREYYDGNDCGYSYGKPEPDTRECVAGEEGNATIIGNKSEEGDGGGLITGLTSGITGAFAGLSPGWKIGLLSGAVVLAAMITLVVRIAKRKKGGGSTTGPKSFSDKKKHKHVRQREIQEHIDDFD